jgi:hypothetical protein
MAVMCFYYSHSPPPLTLSHTHTPMELIFATIFYFPPHHHRLFVKSSNNGTAEYLIKIAYHRRQAWRQEKKQMRIVRCH